MLDYTHKQASVKPPTATADPASPPIGRETGTADPESITPTSIPTTWSLWGGGGDTFGFPPETWQDGIGTIGEILFWYAAGGKRWREPLLKAIAPLEATDPASWLQAEAAINELTLESARAGAVIGYALARTWPGTLEEMADWPRRALAHAGPIQRFTTTGEEGAH